MTPSHSIASQRAQQPRIRATAAHLAGAWAKSPDPRGRRPLRPPRPEPHPRAPARPAIRPRTPPPRAAALRSLEVQPGHQGWAPTEAAGPRRPTPDGRRRPRRRRAARALPGDACRRRRGMEERRGVARAAARVRSWPPAGATEERVCFSDTEIVFPSTRMLLSAQIPAMCFTDEPTMPGITNTEATMQIFSVKVEEIYRDLHWPLDVFGIIAVRDDLDHNRNIIFERKRDNCQTLNEEVRYLVLTGPARAPVTRFGTVHFDVSLKAKCSNELEDKYLSLLAMRYECCESIDYQARNGESALRSCVSSEKCRSKLSTLELACGNVVSSMEATISMRIVEGSWPVEFIGQFSASTASVGHMKVLLLNIGHENPLVVVGTNPEPALFLSLAQTIFSTHERRE